MASYSSPNSLVQPPPPRGASSLRRRSPYARTIADTPRDAAIGHFFAAAVPEPRARRGRATGGAARRSAVAIAMAGEATGETKLAGRRRGLAQPGSRRVVVGGGGDATRFVFSRPKENTWTGARRGDDAQYMARGCRKDSARFSRFFLFPEGGRLSPVTTKETVSRPSRVVRARVLSDASQPSHVCRSDGRIVRCVVASKGARHKKKTARAVSPRRTPTDADVFF